MELPLFNTCTVCSLTQSETKGTAKGSQPNPKMVTMFEICFDDITIPDRNGHKMLGGVGGGEWVCVCVCVCVCVRERDYESLYAPACAWVCLHAHVYTRPGSMINLHFV